ncbi:hypothetical protein EGW08_020995 [Elysia chlorotica]|uniref:C2H2-type domain-containing protein n=1 Tax=Elysia chlorotica TaxID=188477 RepID=A0A433SPT2_ELYCH|nr:hypothetical protein EGW08_020995 [Elysia chlorotica]
MSDFTADLREPRVPFACEDFEDDGDFVADLRPQRLSLKPDHPMEMEVPQCRENSGFASDEQVQGLLSSSQFSTEQTAGLIQASTLTLIKKLLYGHSIAHIEGQIRIFIEDEKQAPVLINFDHPGEERALSPESTDRSPFTHVTDKFNVRVRRNDTGNSHRNVNIPLKSVDWRFLAPRRGSDADSGYEGKSSDEAEPGHMDTETSRLVPGGERLCSSVDSVCTMLGSELRYQREPSCEKATMESASPASQSWEDLDEERSALIIDENYDPEAHPEHTVHEKENLQKHDENHKGNDGTEPSLATTKSDECEAMYTDSQPRSPSLPVDLSGDSEDPRGCLRPQAQNLVLCSSVGPQGLICRLCHRVMNSAGELAEHAAHTHKLHTCVHCFQSFTAKFDLQSHVHTHTKSLDGPNQTTGYEKQQMLGLDDQSQKEEQVLDLSIKKSPIEDKSESLEEVNGLHGALSGRPGEKVSRDGYGQPDPDSVFATITPRREPMREIRRLQSLDGMKNGLVSIKIEPTCGGAQQFALSGSPRMQIVQCKSEEPKDALHIEHTPRAVNAAQMKSQNPLSIQRKPSIRFSPYSREKLAELTAKFIASRKESPLSPPRKDSFPAETSTKMLSTYAGRMAKVNGENSCEVSMSETALKNRVNAFVKSGGHQAQVETLTSTKTSVSSSNNNVRPSDARHRTNHGAGRNTGSGSHACGHEGCGEEFASFQALERHSVDSHGRYLCEHCSKTFTARPNRDRHVRYHTGERPYKCDLCPMAFFRGDDLKYHRTTRHPSAEPFVCKRCNRSFTWNRDLERHQRHCRCKA